MQALQNELTQIEAKQAQLALKQTELLLKIQVANALNHHLPDNLRNSTQVTNWQAAMADKYRWQYRKLYFKQ